MHQENKRCMEQMLQIIRRVLIQASSRCWTLVALVLVAIIGLYVFHIWTLAACCECVGRQSAETESVWFPDWGRSVGEESGGGGGGLDGGIMSLLGLLTCRELHLCDSCLLMLLFLGFLNRLLLSSLTVDWPRSLSVSEDSSMYARFSPKKSSSWQLADEAVLT